MKTLVIHPDDRSTDFLKLIYQGKGFTVINDCDTPRSEIVEAIKNHDRIIMMGHGTPGGLLNPHGWGYIIDSSFTDLLKTKETISIWCNSDMFFVKNNIHDGNLHTKMVISEVGEEYYTLGHEVLNKEEMLANMEAFATVVGECINMEDGQAMCDYIREHYNFEDEVTQYNRDSMITV